MSDRGFSLIEMLIVIVILGIVTAGVVFAVSGFSDDATDNACRGSGRTLATAVEAYFADNSVQTIPATGAIDGEEYERTLVTSGLIRGSSEFWNVAADGQLVSVTPC